jgi:hypothetical protein
MCCISANHARFLASSASSSFVAFARRAVVRRNSAHACLFPLLRSRRCSQPHFAHAAASFAISMNLFRRKRMSLLKAFASSKRKSQWSFAGRRGIWFVLRAFWADKQSSRNCVIGVVSYAVDFVWNVRLTLAFGFNAAVASSRSVKNPELVGICGPSISAGISCETEASSSTWCKEVSNLLKPVVGCCLTVPSMALSGEDEVLSLSGRCNIEERLAPGSSIFF